MKFVVLSVHLSSCLSFWGDDGQVFIRIDLMELILPFKRSCSCTPGSRT